MKSLTAQQIQKLDRLAIKQLGIPSIVLMENAGRAVAIEVVRRLKNRQRPMVSIVCGTGNNGGDGLVAARYLLNDGIKVRVFLVGHPDNFKVDPAIHYHILEKLACPIRKILWPTSVFEREISSSAVIVDALFGVGLARELESPFKEIIAIINRSGRPVLAVDVPSGLDATTGDIRGACIRAKITVTFTCLKSGLLKNAGPRQSGKTIVKNIGIPASLIKKI